MTEAEKLVAAVAKLKEWAGECAECGGTGVVNVKQWPGGIEVDAEGDCDQCADIRKTVAECSP